MKELLAPLKTESLTEVFIERFEHLILSGKLAIGQRLPSERELALQLGVSRPVVHEGLVILSSRGLVRMVPRKGAYINDYRKDGSLEMLTSLVNYQKENLDPDLIKNMLQVRELFENEHARLAALNRDKENLTKLKKILKDEKLITQKTHVDKMVKLDFDFHLNIALSTGNMIYPLLLNSFKTVYTTFTRIFFTNPSVIAFVIEKHKELVSAIESKSAHQASRIMSELLNHGREKLMASMHKQERRKK